MPEGFYMFDFDVSDERAFREQIILLKDSDAEFLSANLVLDPQILGFTFRYKNF